MRRNQLNLRLTQNITIDKYRASSDKSRQSNQVVFWMPVTTNQLPLYAQVKMVKIYLISSEDVPQDRLSHLGSSQQILIIWRNCTIDQLSLIGSTCVTLTDSQLVPQ